MRHIKLFEGNKYHDRLSEEDIDDFFLELLDKKQLYRPTF